MKLNISEKSVAFMHLTGIKHWFCLLFCRSGVLLRVTILPNIDNAISKVHIFL